METSADAAFKRAEAVLELGISDSWYRIYGTQNRRSMSTKVAAEFVRVYGLDFDPDQMLIDVKNRVFANCGGADFASSLNGLASNISPAA